MSILSELSLLIESTGIPNETGYFSGIPPDEYIVITPLAETFELFADNMPQIEIQEARLSLFSKNNYNTSKNRLVKKLLQAGFIITNREYIGFEQDSKYYHFNIDISKEYGLEENYGNNRA